MILRIVLISTMVVFTLIYLYAKLTADGSPIKNNKAVSGKEPVVERCLLSEALSRVWKEFEVKRSALTVELSNDNVNCLLTLDYYGNLPAVGVTFSYENCKRPMPEYVRKCKDDECYGLSDILFVLPKDKKLMADTIRVALGVSGEDGQIDYCIIPPSTVNRSAK